MLSVSTRSLHQQRDGTRPIPLRLEEPTPAFSLPTATKGTLQRGICHPSMFRTPQSPVKSPGSGSLWKTPIPGPYLTPSWLTHALNTKHPCHVFSKTEVPQNTEVNRWISKIRVVCLYVATYTVGQLERY